MKTQWCGVCVAAAVTLAAAAQGPGPTDQDRAAVRQAAYDYGEGFYEGAADRMERGVHPMIVKRGLIPLPGVGSILQPMNAETLVEITRQGGGKDKSPDQRNISFALLDIRDNVASAKIFTVGFNDYLHLVKQDGRWRIASVLWQPPSPKGVANGEADKTAVSQAVKEFMDAIAAADATRIERVTHPEAALRMFRVSPLTGKYFLVEGNRDAFMAQVRMKRMPPLEAPNVTVLDVYDTIASALMTTSNGMTGYFHLAKQSDTWRIVNLLMR
jgi:hypothetical protein